MLKPSFFCVPVFNVQRSRVYAREVCVCVCVCVCVMSMEEMAE